MLENAAAGTRTRTRSTLAPLLALPLAAVVLAALSVVVVAPALQAQVVTGRVVDAGSGGGAGQAIIELFDQDGEKVGVTVAGADGRFQVELVRPGGPFHLTAWAMSYHRATLDSLRVGETQRLDLGEIRLEAAPIPLDTLQVEVEGLLRGRELVRRRQILGQGTFVSGAVIEQDDPYSLTQYLADAADIMVRYGSMSGARTRATDNTRVREPLLLQRRPPPALTSLPYLYSPEAPNQCMHVTINHWPMEDSGYRSLDEIELSWIAAVELYNTPREIPQEKLIGIDAQFKRCGLVNVWLWNSW